MRGSVGLIFHALEEGNVEAVSKMLVDNPNLVNEKNNYGQSVFWLSCCLGHVELVKQILKEPISNIVNIDARDECLRSALDAARDFDNQEIIELLNLVFGVAEYGVINSIDTIEP